MAAMDVLIPAFNCAGTLDASLASIADQSFTDLRIVVVDDGSTDDTPAILAAWAARDNRVVVIRQENGGIVSALNAGLQVCDAPLLARFDSDDIAFPDRLARQKAFLDDHPECVAVGCRVEHIDDGGAPVLGLPQPGSPDVADFDNAPAREPYIIHPFLMVRREALVKAGGYRPVPQSEDSDLYWRLMEFGALVNLEETLGQYRVHQSSLSSQSIVSGRVMAVGSQLGALSARRRKAGKADIVFAPDLHARLRAGETLAGMCAVAEPLLEAEEVRRLRLMAAVKLLELASYRPYEVAVSDCKFARAAMANAWLFSRENFGHMRWHVVNTSKRLMRKGKFSELLALTPPMTYSRVIAKLLIGG